MCSAGAHRLYYRQKGRDSSAGVRARCAHITYGTVNDTVRTLLAMRELLQCTRCMFDTSGSSFKFLRGYSISKNHHQSEQIFHTSSFSLMKSYHDFPCELVAGIRIYVTSHACECIPSSCPVRNTALTKSVTSTRQAELPKRHMLCFKRKYHSLQVQVKPHHNVGCIVRHPLCIIL